MSRTDSFTSDSTFPPAPTHSLGLPRDPAPLPVRVNGGANNGRLLFSDSGAARPRSPKGRPPLGADQAEVNNGSAAPLPITPLPGPAASAGASGLGGGTSDSPAVASPLRAFAGATSVDANTAPETLRQRLERTVTPPLYGTSGGMQEQQRLLQEAQQAGTLDALTSQLEQAPVSASRAAQQELVLGRMRAAVYEMGGDLDRALAERRAVALLATANGEDWFQLAQTEARLGNTASAQRAYAQALRAPGAALSPVHRALAHHSLP